MNTKLKRNLIQLKITLFNWVKDKLDNEIRKDTLAEIKAELEYPVVCEQKEVKEPELTLSETIAKRLEYKDSIREELQKWALENGFITQRNETEPDLEYCLTVGTVVIKMVFKPQYVYLIKNEGNEQQFIDKYIYCKYTIDNVIAVIFNTVNTI